MKKTPFTGPDFLCIGLEKSGTRWLYDQMDHCDKVWMPPIKELNYFNQSFDKPINYRKVQNYLANKNYKIEEYTPEQIEFFETVINFRDRKPKTLNDYHSLFISKGSKLSGDISPSYSDLPRSTIKDIYSQHPKLKIIFLIRHPVDRIMSTISMYFRDSHSTHSIEPFLLKNRYFLLLLLKKKFYKRSYPTKTWTKWKGVFGPNCQFWFFEDIKERPDWVRNEIVSFLGGKNPAFHIDPFYNRKGGRKKFEFSQKSVNLFESLFKKEIRKCAKTFGSHAENW